MQLVFYLYFYQELFINLYKEQNFYQEQIFISIKLQFLSRTENFYQDFMKFFIFLSRTEKSIEKFINLGIRGTKNI